ncbi:MAG: iron-containing alcohol dehydrogenase [Clostridia bacterium]|nr:iron-containing alcohol dehydrogenase [Clostridia bacterium]
MFANLYVNSKVISGKNCVTDNAELMAQFGEKCLIVTSGSAAEKSGALNDVVCALNKCGIGYAVFNKINENPLVSTVIEGGKAARDADADFVIGIGGGSPLDAAKAVAICAANPEYDIDGLYGRRIPSKALPVVLVGTTAGTGSEVTGVSVLTNDKNMQKKSISGVDCYAALVFADAKYTYSMGYDVTVSTALDALAHAVEGWFSPKCDAVASVYAELALKRIYKALKVLAENKALPDENVREDLYYGSVFAGLELNICGAAFPHTVGYVLTENYGIPHGKACTALMPCFLTKAKKYECERFRQLLEILGENEVELIDTIKALTDVKNLDMTDEQLDEWCSRWQGNVKNFMNSPGGFTAEEAKKALKELS